jgi:hypothetical protein
VHDQLNYFLLVAGACSALAALLHAGCIVFGAPWYRFFGAGEQMVRLAEQGSRYPAAVSAAIVLVLALWSVYAFSGAGLLPHLPLLAPALCVITAIFLLRGVAVVVLLFHPLGRSIAFWWWSSAICLAIGTLHLVGLLQAWPWL